MSSKSRHLKWYQEATRSKKKARRYARITFNDSTGKQLNLKRRAKDKAKIHVKHLRKQLEAQEPQTVDWSKSNFGELADYHEEYYCKPAAYADAK